MKWQDLKTEKSEGDAGLFLRWDDGDEHRFVLLGEIEKRETHWTGTRMETCQRAGCGWCAEGNKSGVKLLSNVYDIKAGSTRIWEFSWTTAKDVKDELKDQGWPLWPILRVKRRGTGKETGYRVICDGNVRDEDLLGCVEDANQHDLSQYTKPGRGSVQDDESVPF